MIQEQNGLCAVCELPSEVWYLDHDHTTMEIRGVLCPNCNTGLGQFYDDPQLLRAAIAYLERDGTGLRYMSG